MKLAIVALIALALAGCITSNGAPGELCWEPTDCEVVSCDCDGWLRTAQSCDGELCADKATACAIACAQDAGP